MASVWKTENGEEHFIATLKDGDFFGEGALLGAGQKTATVKAETPLRLMRMTGDHVLEIAEKQPEVTEALEWAKIQREQRLSATKMPGTLKNCYTMPTIHGF